MNRLKIKPESIIEEFFKSIQEYVNEAITERINLMDSLDDFSMKSWEIPKNIKAVQVRWGLLLNIWYSKRLSSILQEKIKFLVLLPFSW